MIIYNSKTESAISEAEFRAAHPTISFPRVLTREILIKHGCDIVLETEKPEYDSEIETVVAGFFEETSDGFKQTWIVQDKLSAGQKATVLENRLKQKKESKLKQLSEDVRTYIYSHYNQGQQNSLIALQPLLPQEKQDRVDAVTTWIQSVLQYNYEMEAALDTDPDTTWDFSQFDATKPADTLKSLIKQ